MVQPRGYRFGFGGGGAGLGCSRFSYSLFFDPLSSPLVFFATVPPGEDQAASVDRGPIRLAVLRR